MTIQTVWKIYETVLEMLGDRGYRTSKHRMSLDEFSSWMDGVENVRGELNRHMTYRSRTTRDRICVLWYSDLGNADVKAISSTMKERGIDRSVVVVLGKITSYASTDIKNLRVLGTIIETFSEKELMFNPTHHQDVPEHTICSEQEKAEVLETYSITKAQLHQIKMTDVMCRYLGASKGDLIRIRRPSETMPEVGGEKLFTISYRIVT